MRSPQYYQTFIEKNFSVIDKYGATVPFKLNAIQIKALYEMTGQDIWLKARRHGMTTLIAAIYTVEFIMTENFRAVIVSHETKATQRILDKVKFFLDSMKRNLPEGVEYPVKLQVASRNELVNEYKNSSFYIGTAGSKSFGRGDQISALHLCLDGKNEILLKDGQTKRLENVLVGDQVMNGRGSFSEVKNVWINDPKELGYDHLLSIKTCGNYLPIECTPDHKILVRSKSGGESQGIWKKAEELTPSDYIAFPKKSTSKRRKNFELSLYQMSFGKRKNSKYVDPVITVDKNLGLLIGWYLCEGHIREKGTSIELAVDKDEVTMVLEVAEHFRKHLTSVSVVPSKDSRTHRIHLRGADFTRMIVYFAGRTTEKHIPNRVWKYGRAFLDGLIQALIEGDGSLVDPRVITFHNTNKGMIYQLKHLCISLGFGYPSIYHEEAGIRGGRNEKENWQLHLLGKGATRFRTYFGYETAKKERNWSRWKGGQKYFYAQVMSVQKIDLPDKVYDIEIDHECHSFTLVNGVVHNSEAAFYDNLDNFLIAVLPAVSGGMVSIESTANGYNAFRELWLRNKLKPRPFHTHFIGWWENPEYSYPCAPNETLTKEEEEILNKYALNKNQMMWRRLELDRMNGDLDKFAQEYPANAEEAFIVSGNHVWSPSILRHFKNMTIEPVVVGNLFGVSPVRFDENEKGYVRIYKAPVQNHFYVIGADVATGGSLADERDSDYSCAQVIDQATFEQVAVWHGRIDPDLFGRQLDMLGQYYNDALLAVERNSIGLTTLTTLRDLYYPNLYYRELFGLHTDKATDEIGWVTDRMTKELIVNTATQLFREKRIRIYDEGTVDEMMEFVRNSSGGAGATNGSHDDKVISLLIAIKMLSQPQVATRGNPIEEEENEWGGGMLFGRNGHDMNLGDPFGEGEVL